MAFVAPEYQVAKFGLYTTKATWYAAGGVVAKVQLNYQKGKDFEKRARLTGITLNTNKVEVLVGNRKVEFFPDIFEGIANTRLIGDLKAVKYLCQSSQSRKMMAAFDDLKASGVNPILVYVIQPGTKVSKPLENEIVSRGGKITYLKME